MNFTSNNESIFSEIKEHLITKGFTISAHDIDRPWGGFFVIDESQAQKFVECFFPGESLESLEGKKISPKILIVAPEKRLSWQYHFRRSELWRVTKGTVGVVLSEDDEETDLIMLAKGDTMKIKQGQRHRLVGLEDYGIVAEIWKHNDPENPSNEEDIVRLQDDFGR